MCECVHTKDFMACMGEAVRILLLVPTWTWFSTEANVKYNDIYERSDIIDGIVTPKASVSPLNSVGGQHEYQEIIYPLVSDRMLRASLRA